MRAHHESRAKSLLRPDVLLWTSTYAYGDRRRRGDGLWIGSACYERLIAIRDGGQREGCGIGSSAIMKRHIDDLAGKRYQENNALRVHDCVLMFVPPAVCGAASAHRL